MSQMDILARLLILEGVGNVDPFTWSHRFTPRTLERVRGVLEGTPNPIWFQAKPTGIYAMLVGRVNGNLSRSGIRHMSGEDILQQAMSGLNRTGQVGKHRFHALGVLAREKILSGQETPGKLANGTLGSWVHRMSLNVIKKKGSGDLSVEDMETSPEPATQPKDRTQVLASCMVGHSEVATRLREIMQQATDERFRHPEQGRAARQIMHAWFDALAEGHLMAPGIDWADAAGILDRSSARSRNTSMVQIWRVWSKASPLLREALEADAKARSLVDLRLTYEADLYAHGGQAALS